MIVYFFAAASAAFGEAALVQGSRGQGGQHSFSFNEQTRDAAIAQAMQNCQRNAFNCVVLRQFRNTCFALAYSVTGGNGYAFGGDQAEANNEALRQCITANGGARCDIVKEFCDIVSQQEIEQQQAAAAAAQVQERIHQRYLQDWDGCRFKEDLGACQRALARASTAHDRELLNQWHAAILAKQQEVRDLAERERLQRAEDAKEDTRRREAAALEATRRREAAAADARAAKAAEEWHASELRGLATAMAGCQRYIAASCDAAQRFTVASEADKTSIRSWRTTIDELAANKDQCQHGDVTACDAALASPAADARERYLLTQWRDDAPLLNRAQALATKYGELCLEMVQSWWVQFRDLPTPIHVASGIAGALILAIRAKTFQRQAETANRPPPPLRYSRRIRRATVRFLAWRERSFALDGPSSPSLPPPTPALELPPPQNAIVLFTGDDAALTARDTPVALRALRLAHAYFEEATGDDLSSPEGQKVSRTTLSLASRQLEKAFHADPNAKLELDGGRVFTQQNLRARVLRQEARTWISDNLGRACTLAEHACQTDPTDPTSFYILGCLHFDNRNRAKAIAAATRAYELDPDDIETCKLLDRAQNMGDAEILTYKVTRAGVGVANTGIGIYNTGVKAWNIFAITYNIVTFPIRLPFKILKFFNGGRL